MFQEYDVVKLKHDISTDGPNTWPIGSDVKRLPAGTTGTIVMVYTKNSVDYEYDVEFLDKNGQTLALVQLKEDELELVQRASS